MCEGFHFDTYAQAVYNSDSSHFSMKEGWIKHQMTTTMHLQKLKLQRQYLWNLQKSLDLIWEMTCF